jgi:tellurite resistance protein
MANKTLTITAPAELIDAVIAAYAAKGQPEQGQTDEQRAIEMMVDQFRDEVVAFTEQKANEVVQQATREGRLANRNAAEKQREAMRARRAEVQVTIQ